MADRPAAGQICAAGGVVWRPGQGGPRLALIHRPKYDDWTLPKGKCEPGEHVLLAAVREIAEETGMQVTLGMPLGRSRYQVDGRPKRVDYWAACSEQPAAAFQPGDEVDDLSWLSAGAASAALSYQREQAILARFAAAPAITTPFILLRHASAGSKGDWPGADIDRPLDARGAADADSLARLLSCYGRCQVISSSAERCVATVRPYAQLTGARIELEPLFTMGTREGDQAVAACPGTGRSGGSRRRDGQPVAWPGAQEGSRQAAQEGSRQAAQRSAADPVVHRMTAITRDERPVVICAHRENLPLLLAAACAQLGSEPPRRQSLRKGGFLVLHRASGTLAAIERHHPVQT